MQLSWLLVATTVLGELAYYTALSWRYDDDQVQFKTLQCCKKIAEN